MIIRSSCLKKKINKQDSGCWKGLGLPGTTCLFLLLISLLLGFLSFQRGPSWVPREHLESHFRHPSEMVTEERDVGCCGQVVHPHTPYIWQTVPLGCQNEQNHQLPRETLGSLKPSSSPSWLQTQEENSLPRHQLFFASRPSDITLF